MTNSQNGWPIKPTDRSPLTVAGVPFGDVRSGDVFTVLQYVATRYHNEVEHLIRGTCGAYNPRKIPGSDTWSNHASATAIDCNWQRHPLGARGTYSSAQLAAVRRIVADCDGVIRWGGVYTTTVDEMHFEINKNAAAVKALAAKIRNEGDDMTAADLTEWAESAAGKAALAAAAGSGVHGQKIGKSSITMGMAFERLLLADGVDEQAIVAGVLAGLPGLTPAAIAAAIPPEIASDVADEIAARLGRPA
jgi:hypothetical protein